jgi:hypothetical protein
MMKGITKNLTVTEYLRKNKGLETQKYEIFYKQFTNDTTSYPA